MIFIAIDAFVAGVLYVLLNNFYTYIKHGNSTDFQIRLLPAKDIFVGIFFGLYKFSLVPFYWLILFVIVRRNSLILKASLVRTVLYFTGCFLISFAVFAILNISMVSNSTGSVISLWTNPAYGKFALLGSRVPKAAYKKAASVGGSRKFAFWHFEISSAFHQSADELQIFRQLYELSFSSFLSTSQNLPPHLATFH